MLNFALDHGAVGVKGSKNRYFAEIQVWSAVGVKGSKNRYFAEIQVWSLQSFRPYRQLNVSCYLNLL